MMDSGEAIRTYCYISDAVEIMWQVLLFGTEPIYNLGGHSQTSIAGLARQVGSILNVPVVIPPTNKSVAGAPKDVKLSMKKTETEFGKEEYVPLERGLERTINWYLSVKQYE